jgi:predicted methyltransferase
LFVGVEMIVYSCARAVFGRAARRVSPRLPAALAGAIAVGAAFVGGCAAPSRHAEGPAAAPAKATTPAANTTAAALDRVLAGAHRSDASRARDVYRHPKATLEFFGVRPDQTVMEIWPGAGGWYTEILAPLLRDHGQYVAAGWDPKSDLKFVQDGIRSFQAKLDGNPELYGKVRVTALQPPAALAPVPPESVDLIVTFRNLHNWAARDEAPVMLKAMYTALKPGGVLGLVDHRADPNAALDPHARTGYVNQQYAIELATNAGFEFVAASEINANPKDTRDYEQGVWTLPPTWRLGDKDRDRFAAIGESDRFTLKFRKPLSR